MSRPVDAAGAAQAATRGDMGGLGERLGSLLAGGKDDDAVAFHGKTCLSYTII